MKRKISRELALISLPLVIIGGAAWLVAGSGRTLLPARFDNGPARLTFSPFQTVEVSAMEVYQGVDWKVGTSVKMKGKLQVPVGWKPHSIAQVWTDDYRIVYRIGKKWKRATTLPGESNPIAPGFDFSSGAKTFNLHLETVPTNAEEVRFRGRFTESHDFTGALPPNWKPPKNYAKVGKFHSFTVEAKPFDLLVKAPGQPMPRPMASRETGVRVVKASYDSSQGKKLGMSVQLRREPEFGQPKNYEGASLVSLQLLDGKGQQLDVCEAAGSPANNISMGLMNRDGLHLADTDFIVSPRIGFARGEQPCGGWKKANGPYKLRAAISDQSRWPVVVDVPVPAAISTN